MFQSLQIEKNNNKKFCYNFGPNRSLFYNVYKEFQVFLKKIEFYNEWSVGASQVGRYIDAHYIYRP